MLVLTMLINNTSVDGWDVRILKKWFTNIKEFIKRNSEEYRSTALRLIRCNLPTTNGLEKTFLISIINNSSFFLVSFTLSLSQSKSVLPSKLWIGVINYCCVYQIKYLPCSFNKKKSYAYCNSFCIQPYIFYEILHEKDV